MLTLGARWSEAQEVPSTEDLYQVGSSSRWSELPPHQPCASFQSIILTVLSSQALCIANTKGGGYINAIRNSTKGILFFGTPH